MSKSYSMIIVATLLLFFVPVMAMAQVSADGTPTSFSTSVSTNVEQVTMPVLDIDALMQEDAQQGDLVPPRFGFPIPVDLGLDNAGTWETLPDGSHLWRLKIASDGAYSINLIYDDFWLPDGATFFIYNEQETEMLGAFTAANNKPHGKFATTPVFSDVIVLEYHEPARIAEPGRIHISTVVHAYRNLRDYGDSDSCQNNVNCPEGAAWSDVKRSVAMILVGGSRICTGALVNNTAEDGTPYFLTATHCLDADEDGEPDPDVDVSTWTFMFNYESATCTNADGPTNQSVSGSTLRIWTHVDNASDMTLLELDETPPASYGVYYAGWQSADTPPASGAGIHHPSGDIKKISLENDPAVSDFWLNRPNSHWMVSWDDGVTEPGSSGSPFFDNDHRLVGVLTGGTSYCTAPNDPDWYGKLAMTFGDTNIETYLDPTNSGVTAIDGYDPNSGGGDINTVLVAQDFEGGASDNWNYTPDPAPYNASGDVWDVVSSLGGITPQSGSSFWGMQDLENDTYPGGIHHVLDFDPIDVSGQSNVSLEFYYYTIEFDTSNGDTIGYYVEYDNGTNWGTRVDLNADSQAWTAVQINVPDGASHVRLRLMARQNGGSDYAGFDNIQLTTSSATAVDNPANFAADAVSISQIDLSWQLNGNSDDVVLAFNTSNTFGSPSGSYNPGDTISGGGQVLYVGTGLSYNHTGLTENGTYYYKAWSVDGSQNYSTGLSTDATTLKGEPDAHASAFSATAVNSQEIQLTWTDASRAVPDAYLIKASTTSFAAITDPVDGTPVSNDYDLSDGSGAVNVDQGQGSFNWYNLVGDTEYFFKIYPYTNTDSDIDYKTDGTVPTASATTPATPPFDGFEDFEAGTEGWVLYNQASSEDWERRSGTGANGTTYYMYCNGFGGDAPASDWLISPVIDLTTYTNPQLAFYALTQYNDTITGLEVKISTNYAGSGDPGSATWTTLSASLPAPNSETWTEVGPVDLSPYAGSSSAYVTFHYQSTGTSGGSSALWEVDEVGITSMSGVVDPSNFTATAAGETQIDLSWNLNNDGDDVLIATSPDNTFGVPSGSYTVGDPISGGGEVIYLSNGTSFAHQSLTPSTTYYYKAWSVDGTTTYSTGVTASAMTQGPYYAGIDPGLTGDAMKTALHNLIRTTHTNQLSYSEIWDVVKYTDEDPNNTNNVIMMYTGESRPKSESNVTWNREHVWPNGLGIDDSYPAYGDAHHLRPCDFDVNGARGSLDFDNGGTEFVDNGTPTGCNVLNGISFEPPDDQKGDAARMVFYMDTRYEGTDTGFDLEMTEDPNASDGSSSLLGVKATLLQWHVLDPVDAREITRNDRVFAEQGNRNPFIDHPEWVASIWGDVTETQVNFAAGSATINEGATTFDLTVNITNPTATATTADVVFTTGTPSGQATSDDLDGFASQGITFPGGSSASQTVTLTITDDALEEGTETFTFALQNVSGGDNAAPGAQAQFILTIEDNDAPASSDIVITEIMQNPSAVGDTDGEWFELYNASASPVDLNGWTIQDAGSDSYQFSQSIVIPADGYIVLCDNDDDTTNGGVTCDATYSGMSLANGDDELILLNGGGTEIDRVEYDGGPNFPDPNGASMMLNDPALDNNVADNWSISDQIWPNSAGDMGTPGDPNDTTYEQDPLEILTGPTATAYAITALISWETNRAGDSSYVEYGLTTSYGMVQPFNNATLHQGYLTGLSENTTYHYRVGTIEGMEEVVSNDGTFSTGTFANPTASLVINEIFFNASGTDDNKEWFEVYNAGPTAVDINNWILRDAGGDLHTISGASTIQPGDYYVLGQSSDTGQNGGVTVDYVYGAGFFLANSDDEIVLETSAGIQDSVHYYDAANGWDDPLPGQALALLQEDLDNALAENWVADTLSAHQFDTDSYGTPGAQNFEPGDDSTPPVISNVQVTNITATGATVSFDTDEPTTGRVNYGLSAGSYPDFEQSTTLATSHTIELTGLTPNTTYHFEVCATDEALNSACTDDDTFVTTDAPALVEVVINEIMQNPDTVGDSDGEWFEVYNPNPQPVDLDGWTMADAGSNLHTISGSVVVPAAGYAVLCVNADEATNGGVTCDYEYNDFSLANGDDEIILTDAFGREVDRVEYDGGPTFPDPTGASMALIQPDLDNNVGDNWTTSQQAWAGSSGDLGSPGAENTFDLTAPNFTSGPTATPDITTATIDFETDEPTTFVISYGLDDSYGQTVEGTDLDAVHQVELTGLTPNTTYHYQVCIADAFGNGPTCSADDTFQTEESADTTPPVISNVQVTNVSANSATISFDTDEPTTGQVNYGLSAGSYPDFEESTTLTTSHTIELTGLTPNTTYHFEVCAFDESLNEACTDDDTFTTADAPDLVEVVINEIMQNPQAVGDSDGEWFEVYNPNPQPADLDGWTMADAGSNLHTISGSVVVPAAGYAVLCVNDDEATNGGVTCDYEYSDFSLANGDDEVILTDALGREVDRVEYDGGPVFPDPTNGASMALIQPDLDNNVGDNWTTSQQAWAGSSGDKGSPGAENTFDLTAPNFTSGPTATPDITTATIDFEADEPTTFVISYGLDDSYGQTVEGTDLDAVHQVELTGLTPNTTYHYQVCIADAFGNGPTCSADDTFQTEESADTTPPVISNVQVTNITATGATVSFDTDEPTTGQVNYGLSAGTYPDFAESLTPGTSHSITLTGLAPNTTYHFEVCAFDLSFNSACTADETFMTNDVPDLVELVISEIMQNPQAVGDSDGEWFELYNPNPHPVDIGGWVLADAGIDLHTIVGSVVAPAQGFVVLCINDDEATNGGVGCDYEYSDFSLSNGDDEIILTDPFGREVDRVDYDGGPAFPDPNGASMALYQLDYPNHIGGFWVESQTEWPGSSGDKGSPGATNFVPNDTNFDGVVDDADVMLILVNILNAGDYGIWLDINEDGQITIEDIIMLIDANQ